MEREHTYRSYLLRLWPAKMDGDTWRASLECVQTKEIRGFESLEAMCAFLREGLQQEEVGDETVEQGMNKKVT